MILEANIEQDFLLKNVGEMRYILIKRNLDIATFEQIMFNALTKEHENLQNKGCESTFKFPKFIYK